MLEIRAEGATSSLRGVHKDLAHSQRCFPAQYRTDDLGTADSPHPAGRSASNHARDLRDRLPTATVARHL